MKLKYLKIKGFKNLTGEDGWFHLDFTNKDGITVLIGNNGSGKSNVLEAISAIFQVLYKINKTSIKPAFNYVIEYSIGEETITDIKIELINGTYSFYLHNEETPKKDFVEWLDKWLPSKIIASYSGEERRLWDKYYEYWYNDFITSVKKNELRSLPEQKLFYIDSDYWNEALLVFLLSDLDSNKNFVLNNLGITSVESIEFTFDIERLNKYQSNIITDFVTMLNPTKQNSLNITLASLKELMLGYEYEWFIKLISSSQSELIANIKINFNNNLTTEDLSEGQKKQILIRAILEFIADRKTLVLLDEPDSHIHVANKVQFINVLEEYEYKNLILTTHSPTLTHTFEDKHINMLNNGQIENKQKQEIFSHITDGIWNYQEQTIFLSSSKNIILLVEGKHDKIHIQEAFKRLGSDYMSLDFDVFYADGSDKLKQLIIGFSTSDFNLGNKKIIAIFDDDDEGRKGRSQQNFDKKTEEIYTLKSNINFYGILLPKKENFKGEFTIENMYDASKFKESMNISLTKRLEQNDFFNTGINDISKNIKDDAKNHLMNSCKEFVDGDFDHFRKLFDLIKYIKISF